MIPIMLLNALPQLIKTTGELVVLFIKITIITALCGALVLAFSSLVTFITSIVFPSIVWEIFGIISVTLPFDAVVVFGSISLALISILSFMIAFKIYDLTSAYIRF